MTSEDKSKPTPVQVTLAPPTKPLDRAMLHTANAVGVVFFGALWIFIALFVVLVIVLLVASC